MFTETGIIIIIVLEVIGLTYHFVDKMSSSSCTSKNHKVEIKMKKTDEHE